MTRAINPLAAEVRSALRRARRRQERAGRATVFRWGFAIHAVDWDEAESLAATTLGGETVRLTWELVHALTTTLMSLYGRAPIVFSPTWRPMPTSGLSGQTVAAVEVCVLVGPRLASATGARITAVVRPATLHRPWVVLTTERPPAWPR